MGKGVRLFGKAVSLIMMFLLVMGTLALVFNVQPVKSDYAWTQTIYIQSDGSIQPPTAPIFSIDNVTYTLTDNITGAGARAISIQRNNTIIDGAGHTLQGINASNSEGIDVTGSNVAIKNMKIIAFTYGIFLDYSSGNTLSGNNVTANNGVGVVLETYSDNNTLSGNNIANNYDGIAFDSNSGNT
ncbi:MAG: right-handed parallel beta-helix repeat-containing protein, partial [Candidatus Bathyarchaeia archaeon]